MTILLVLLMSVTVLAQNRPDASVLPTRADALIFTAKTVRLAATQATGFASYGPPPAGQIAKTTNLQQIPGTTIKLALVSPWRLEPKRSGPGGYTLTYKGDPEYALTVSQTTPAGIARSCISLIGFMAAAMQATKRVNGTIESRPPFIPDIYFGSVFSIQDAQMTCLNTGDGQIGVQIQLVQGAPKPQILTPMLTAIAAAAMKESKVVSSPGNIKLPLLGIEIPVRNGAWGVWDSSDTWGKHDQLERAATPGGNEMHVSPFLLKSPGGCDSLMSIMQSPMTTARSVAGGALVKGRRYGGARWHPDAWEQFPAPLKALQAYACRNVGQDLILIARIDYEKTALSEPDIAVVRQLLDDIGESVERKLTGK